MPRTKQAPKKYRYLLTIKDKTYKTDLMEASYDVQDVDLLGLLLAIIWDSHQSGKPALFPTESGVVILPPGVAYHLEIGTI